MKRPLLCTPADSFEEIKRRFPTLSKADPFGPRIGTEITRANLFQMAPLVCLIEEEEEMQLHKIWIEQCEAARGIEDEFGTPNALKYLVGEKFLNYLQAAEKDAEFRAELPAFVAEIKTIFEQWQLAEYLEKAGWTEPFDPSLYDEDHDPEIIEMERKSNLRQVASELMLLESAKEWLLEKTVDPS